MATRTGYGDGGAASRRRSDNSGAAWAWVGAIVLALILALIIVPMVYDPGEGTTAGPNAGATLCDVTDNPQEFYGNTVTVSGEVSDVLSTDTFVLGGDEFIGGCQVLVVGVEPFESLLGDDVDLEDRPVGAALRGRDVVQVTGTMRRFVVADIEAAIGADLQDDLLRDWEGKPALVARQIFLNPRKAQAAPSPKAEGGATLADITDNPEEFLGDEVTVDGIVAETIDPRLFVIVSPGDKQLVEGAGFTELDRGVLVANTTGSDVLLKEGQAVQAKGTVQKFDVGEVKRALGVTLEDGLFTNWAGRPVVMADQIQGK